MSSGCLLGADAVIQHTPSTASAGSTGPLACLPASTTAAQCMLMHCWEGGPCDRPAVGVCRIIGVDLDKNKFERAMKWGCTECINPKDHDKSIVVRSLGVVSAAKLQGDQGLQLIFSSVAPLVCPVVSASEGRGCPAWSMLCQTSWHSACTGELAAEYG